MGQLVWLMNIHLWGEHHYPRHNPADCVCVCVCVCVCALLQDAPLLHLERVVGFGGLTCPVLFSANGKEAVFACHHTVVAMDTGSRRQRFFAGHSDKV